MGSSIFIRGLDMVGRISVPSDFRNLLDIKLGDSIEIFSDENQIVLRKMQISCVFCGNMEQSDSVLLHGQRVCAKCRKELKKESMQSTGDR